jgi:hypothetical protein
MIAARLVAIRVWWLHTRIGEGSADVANHIQGDFEVLSHQKGMDMFISKLRVAKI